MSSKRKKLPLDEAKRRLHELCSDIKDDETDWELN